MTRRRTVVFAVVTGAVAAIAVLLLAGAPASAAPADPRTVALEQPDGSTFEARLWGDEFVNGYETAAGYTVVRAADGRWVFARAAAGGELRPTASAPTGRGEPDPALGLRRHLRDAGEVTRALDLREAAAGPGGDAEATTSLGPAPTLVLLVRFADQAEQTSVGHWAGRFFGGSDSVAAYYDEVSRGQVQVVPAGETSGGADDGVVGWLDLPIDHPDTGAQVGGAAARALTVQALTAADPFVEYGQFDTRAPFGALTPDELHLVVVPAGSEAADGCAAPTMWAHRSSLAAGDGAAAPPTLDGVVLGNGEVEGGYLLSSEMGCDGSGTYPQSVGILAHELGHDLGFLDLYDIDGSSAGVGGWSLMGQHRGQLVGEPSGTHPPHVDPFHKAFAGWVAPTPVVSAGPVALDDAVASGQVAQVGDNPGGVDIGFLHRDDAVGEYFLVENRQRTGFDAALPGCGLLIWHIDETSFGNVDESRRIVDVEEANEAVFADGGFADDGDPWPGSSGATRFDTATTPDSRRNDGRPTGVSLDGFDAACAPTMHATVDPGGGGSPPPPVPGNDDFADARPLAGTATLTGYNQGATREPGEPRHDGVTGGASVWWQWTAPADGLASLAVEPTFDAVVAVYTGERVDRLERVTSGPAVAPAAGGPPAAGSSPAARVTEDLDVGAPSFPVVEGVTYRVAVDGRGAATGGIRVALRFDPIDVTVATSPSTVTPGAQVTVEVTVTELDGFLGMSLWDLYDDAGHQCQPQPAAVGAGGTAGCGFTMTAPAQVGERFGSTVSVSGEFEDGTFFFHRVAWSAEVEALAPPPTPTSAPEAAPTALARTGAEPLPLARLAVVLLAVGAAFVFIGSRRRRRAEVCT